MSCRWDSDENVRGLLREVDDLTLALRVGAAEPSDGVMVDLLLSAAQLVGEVARSGIASSSSTTSARQRRPARRAPS